MKHGFLSLAMLLAATANIAADEISEIETYANDQLVNQYFDLPVVREVKGGTKIVVTYDGDWTPDMKGAFEYACEIWEENMPTSLPIYITAKLAPISASGNNVVLSKVTMQKKQDTQFANSNGYQMHWRSQIKGVILEEYIYGQSHQFVENLQPDFFTQQDATITYNTNKIDDFSFSLDASSIGNKYDFVTLALRDIAKVFGFTVQIARNGSNPQLLIDNSSKTPFESEVINVIGTNASTAYTNATQGSVALNIQSYGTLQLYAPTTWVNDVSLNYFIPDSNKRISQLLSHDFGKGSIIRDISDNYSVLFRELLGWEKQILSSTSPTGSMEEIATSTSNAVPYNGSITFGANAFNLNDNAVVETFNGDENVTTASSTNGVDPEVICKPFDPSLTMTGTINDQGTLTVAILKKDGYWDIVDEIPTIPQSLNTTRFEYHYDLEDYCRTADGYLRCRINYFDRGTYGQKLNTTYYFLLNHLPPTVEQGFVGVVNIESTRATYDEYLRDIKIGIKNLEGVTRVVVEQLDEGERVPFRFDVSDFKDGYYIATVDKEFYSEFKVIAYNANGGTISETLVVEPLEPVALSLSTTIVGDEIEITTNNARRSDINYIQSYAISPLTNYRSNALLQGANLDNCANRIDISGLPSGLYALNIIDIYGERHSFKFMKK